MRLWVSMDYENEYKRAEYFFKNKIKIHVSKKDGAFYNGEILELETVAFVIGDIKGNQFIYFSELNKPLEPFKEKGE